MNPNNYHIVRCCFYCYWTRNRKGTTVYCDLEKKPRDVGGLCDEFLWAPDNAQHRANEIYLPEEAVRAAKAARVISKLQRICPILKTGVPDNPCRKCEGREYCDVGRKAKV